MPEGSRIVACAHSSNGVCATCKALLEMPGEVVMISPGPAMAAPAVAVASAPGRAVATDTAPGHAAVAAGDPEPIGVMQTNYMANAPAKPVQPVMPYKPGAGTPYLGEQSDSKPHILGHLFGFTEMKYDLQDKMDEGNKKKKAKHAAISYDPGDGKVQELPASMVYGPKGQRKEPDWRPRRPTRPALPRWGWAGRSARRGSFRSNSLQSVKRGVR